MVLDTKKYVLKDGVEGYRQDIWKLTKTEMKLLKLLADNDFHSQKQIYSKCGFKNKNTTRVYIYRLRKKIPELDIIMIYEVGYRLNTCIKVQ